MTNNLKDQKILIFGLGLNQGGVGSAKFFAQNRSKVRITDLRNKKVLKESIDQLKVYPDIEYSLEGHKNEDIDWADLIIKNAAIKPGNPYIGYALKIGKEVKMDMDIFLENVKPSQIVGVTGTKGKSTTSSLIHEILKISRGSKLNNPRRWKILFAGNIGKSVLDTIPYINPETLVILEISSFQLESFDHHRVSPKWAVITNITPDHLNYHKNMEEYVNAKKIIGKYQSSSDYLFLRKGDPITTKTEFLKAFEGKIIHFSKDDLPRDFKPQLKGAHNLENIAVAFQVGKVFNINSNLLLKSLTNFKGIPFRMELIKEWNGIKIYNDTAATSPEAGIKAIQTFPNCILICGGMNKGMDYKEFAKIVDENVKKVFLLEGDSTEEIKRLIKNKDLITKTYSDFEKLLQDLKAMVKSGDIILLSPAATSFNLFQNEWDRGRKFNEVVERLFK